jgi:hypothetical protein
LTPSPIGKGLSTFRSRRVLALLMGGQACVLYGAAEFSRDVDVAVRASDANLAHLRRALDDLRGEPVFVRPLGRDVLLRGSTPFPQPPARARLPRTGRLRHPRGRFRLSESSAPADSIQRCTRFAAGPPSRPTAASPAAPD